MKASRDARTIASNTLARVRRDAERGKIYPCLDHGALALAVDSVAQRKGRSMVCEHCDRFLAFGDKTAHTLSPSLHKVRPSHGYVAGNLACFAWNATRRSARRKTSRPSIARCGR